MREVPALIIGSGLSVLGAARLFGRAGVRAYCFGPPQLEAHSRWYRTAPGLRAGQPQPDRLAAYLAESPFDRAVLMPASDAAVRAIAGLPPDLRKRFPASVGSLEVAAQLTDKALFGETLRRLGEPHPKTQPIERMSDLQSLPEEAFQGSFLKPADSASFMARFGVKGSLVASRADAMRKAELALSEGFRLVLQEYIPTTRDPGGKGPRGDHVLLDAFIDRNGQICAMFARRRLRMFPPDFGNTSCMVSIAASEVPAPAASLARIAQALECRGILSAEFKQDPRDGIYKLLEINSRLWWFVEFAGRCGVDLCAMSYLDALEERVEPVTTYRVGAKFVHAYYDYYALKSLYREGKLGMVAAARSWAGAQDPSFNWTDPMPAIVEALGHLRSRYRRHAHASRIG